MLDAHIHIERGPYTLNWIEKFVNTAEASHIDELYLLEHSHRFIEFEPMYSGICHYSNYQRDWFTRKSAGLSISEYTNLITQIRCSQFPVKLRFGLEVCYFPDSEALVKDIIGSFNFDFVTGAIHWIDNFGFDHKPELWDEISVDDAYRHYYVLIEQLIKSNLFSGVAHPDSIKCFGHMPSFDLTDTYIKIAELLNKHSMYDEQSGGLRLNYPLKQELGMNKTMLDIFTRNNVRILPASDAHCPEHTGANIAELSALINQA